MEYKLKEIEDDENMEKAELPVEDRVIEKRGHLITFTLHEVQANDAINKKNLKELIAKRDYENARMKNIEEHHPFVLDMPEFDRRTIHMYTEAEAMSRAAERTIEEIEKQIADDEEEIEEIFKQIPEFTDTNHQKQNEGKDEK